MRQPTIHISRVAFIHVIGAIMPNLSTEDKVAVAEKIIELSEPYALTGRQKKLVKATKATKSKVDRFIAGSTVSSSSIATFWNILLPKLKDKKVANTSMPTSGADYLILQEVVQKALQLKGTYPIGEKELFKFFITTGLGYMGKYDLGRFRYLAPKIGEDLSHKMLIEEDPTPDITTEIFVCYCEEASTKVDLGLLLKRVSRKVPKKYVHFIYAKEDIAASEASISDWVKAQFKGLAFTNTVPEPTQLYGEQAKDRYLKYMLKGEENKSLKDIYGDNDD